MPKRYLHCPMKRKFMQRNARRDIANLRMQRLSNYTKSRRRAWMIINLEKKKLDQLEKCPQFAPKLWNVYIWHVLVGLVLMVSKKLARAFTKWTKSCDKRLSRLISYIHHTCEYRQYCHVGNTAEQCRLGLFQDSDFAGDLEDSNSTSGGTLCTFGKSYICSNKLDVQETNCRFAQFNRIWNYLFGHWIDIGWFACSGIIGSNCLCSRKCFSCFTWIRATW